MDLLSQYALDVVAELASYLPLFTRCITPSRERIQIAAYKTETTF